MTCKHWVIRPQPMSQRLLTEHKSRSAVVKMERVLIKKACLKTVAAHAYTLKISQKITKIYVLRYEPASERLKWHQRGFVIK
jgi:hypothetical protein